MTYGRLLSATVISFLQDRRIEIVEVEFSLKRNLVVGVEEVKRERRLRLMKGRWIPANPQELAIPLNPLSVLHARAKLHVETVDPVDIDHNDGLGSAGA